MTASKRMELFDGPNYLDQELHEYHASQTIKDAPVFHGKVAFKG
jgi:hypothetical protein